MNLTPKQKRFCDEYLIDLNATQAAIRAGYSKRTAYAIGQENLKKLEMQEKDNELIASQDEVLKYLTRVMRREEQENVVVVTKKETTDWVVNGEGRPHKQTIKEEQPKVVEIPTRVSDSNKAAELLAKRYGLLKENLNLEGAIPIVIIDDMEEDDE